MIDSGFGFFLTKSAFDRICALRSEKEFPVALRMSVIGGGCSGFQYVFSMERIVRNSDQKGGVAMFDNKDVEDDDFDDDIDEDDFDEDDLDDESDFGDDEYDDDEFDDESGYDDDDYSEYDDDAEMLDSDGNVYFLTDKGSLKFLNGAVIDYVQNIMGSGFCVNNPNAVTKCGCGNSFSV